MPKISEQNFRSLFDGWSKHKRMNFDAPYAYDALIEAGIIEPTKEFKNEVRRIVYDRYANEIAKSDMPDQEKYDLLDKARMSTGTNQLNRTYIIMCKNYVLEKWFKDLSDEKFNEAIGKIYK